MIAAIAFYLFAAVLIASAVMVVTSRNPVHSVLFLILAFFNAAALFLLAGAEFLAMILVIVYVGAVAVLFLFVVMMLDVDFSAIREGFQRYFRLRQLDLCGGCRRAAAEPDGGWRGQHARDRPHPLHGLRLAVSAFRPDPAGGDDRRHRADTTQQAAGQAPGYRQAGEPHG
jgi:hypothetical protein